MNSAEDNIDPLTKVYTTYQEEHKRSINQRTINKQSQESEEYKNKRTNTLATISTAHSTSGISGPEKKNISHRSMSP